MAITSEHAHPAAPHLRGGPAELRCDRCGARFEAGRFSLEDVADELDAFVRKHVHAERLTVCPIG